MSANVNGKRQCVTCNKGSGILICDGCQQLFCSKHTIEHRQKLANQLDEVMQDYDLFQQELDKLKLNNSLLKKIDKWEEESITKIQVAAEVARADLMEILTNSKQRIFKTCHDIALNVQSSREADDFCESDIKEWMKKLDELKTQYTTPPTIKLTENKYSVIPLIMIKTNNSTKTMLRRSRSSLLCIAQERFSQVFGTAIIEDEDLLARHIGCRGEYGFVFGERQYSTGRHMIRFMIEFNRLFFDTYLGCVSSKLKNSTMNYNSSFVAGWFGCNEIYQHGICEANDKETGYDSSEIRTKDILCLTFDCDKHQIELTHESTNKTHILPVNLEKAPFPWQLFVVLSRPDDRIKILDNI
ncbi:unnamed protein product [Adineta steineri]|uniref:B box-type domain-containing protein n=1 Tax=Adineta steineri TaxID=433720 RepID=A0A819DJ55_9BILA|nr:unnamed protein product [Adineta steineri]CAF3839202.1 unnamed protein product [Adineta steineri]